MSYELIPLVAVICLTARYFFRSTASERAKHRLCGITALAVIATLFVPLVASLAQLAICIYILIDQMVSEANRECPP